MTTVIYIKGQIKIIKNQKNPNISHDHGGYKLDFIIIWFYHYLYTYKVGVFLQIFNPKP